MNVRPRRMRCRTAAGLALSLLAVAVPGRAATAPHPGSPSSFVRSLYARYPLREGQSGVAFGDDLAEWFSEPLLGALARDRAATRPGEETGLDSDPLCACQDDEGFRLESLTESRVSADGARVAVRFRLAGLPHQGRVTLILRRTRAGWRIADIGNPGVPSVAQALAPEAHAPR